MELIDWEECLFVAYVVKIGSVEVGKAICEGGWPAEGVYQTCHCDLESVNFREFTYWRTLELGGLMIDEISKSDILSCGT